MNTRELIIYESLKLFSKNGFEAVSTRMIARAVNASDAVIYKHFKNKQEIFDTIVSICSERFYKKREAVDIRNICWAEVEAICMDMFKFQTQDEWIVLFRRMLIVEQFKNEKIAKLYRKIFIDSPVDSMTLMFNYLVSEGHLKSGNTRVYAMELYAPFFMYHTIHISNEQLLSDLEEHVSYFRENYRTHKGGKNNGNSNCK